MTKKGDLLGFSLLILLIIILLVFMGWMVAGLPIAPTKHKTEIVEVYDIAESGGDYLLITNSTIWPNSPMRLSPWGYASLEGIIFVERGDILELDYKIVYSLIGLGEPKFHHTSLKVLYDISEERNDSQ